MEVYLCFVFTKGSKDYPPELSEFIGTYATEDLAKEVCEAYNENPNYKARGVYADYFKDTVNTHIEI